MTNHEFNQHDGLTREDISDAYGDWHTHSEEGVLTRAEMEQALRVAAEDIYRCTVAITTMYEEDEIAGASFENLRPGTGVLVKSSGVHGIVTAAHVLGVEGNRRRYEQGRCTIAILLLQPARTRAGEQVYFRIRRRRCLAYGVDNRGAAGPDIAYIPLTPREWALLEPDGVRAWTPFEEPDPGLPRNTVARVLLDCCVGPNHKATQKVLGAHPEARPGIAFQALQFLEIADARTDIGPWDYTKVTLKGDDRGGSAPVAPRGTPAQTYRAFLDHEWHTLSPRDMLGGLSGTGLWTAQVRVDKKGRMSLHAKRLKGLLFYAGPGLDATLHGPKSIRRIMEAGLELHGQAAMDEAQALKEAARRSGGADGSRVTRRRASRMRSASIARPSGSGSAARRRRLRRTCEGSWSVACSTSRRCAALAVRGQPGEPCLWSCLSVSRWRSDATFSSCVYVPRACETTPSGPWSRSSGSSGSNSRGQFSRSSAQW